MINNYELYVNILIVFQNVQVIFENYYTFTLSIMIGLILEFTFKIMIKKISTFIALTKLKYNTYIIVFLKNERSFDIIN